MPELNKIIGDPHAFLYEIIGEIEDAGVDLDDFSQMDHMCYRTETDVEYKEKQAQIKSVARLLGETIVSGRKISTFRLNQPVKHGRWRIDAIELPAPKAGSPKPSGLEHVELVMYDDLADFMAKYGHLPLDTKSADRGINPEIGLQLTDIHSVKFHLLPLTTVVFLEHKLGITKVDNEPSDA